MRKSAAQSRTADVLGLPSGIHPTLAKLPHDDARAASQGQLPELREHLPAEGEARKGSV